MPANSHMEAVDSEYLYDGLNPSNTPTQQKRVEYWSKTYRMWIPAEITAVDHETCAVQVNVKPGVWLTSSDWDKKLRVAVYLCSDNPSNEEHTEISQRDCETYNMKKPQFHEELGKEYENINPPHFNEMYPNYPFDEISRCGDQDIVKDQESCLRPSHEAACSDEADAPVALDITRYAAVAGEDDQEMRDFLSAMSLHEAHGDTVPRDEAASATMLDTQSAFQEGYLGRHADASAVPDPFALIPDPFGLGMQADASAVPVPIPFVRDGHAHLDLDSTTAASMPFSTAVEIPGVTFVTAASVADASNAIRSEGRFAGYRCPSCGEGGLESIQEALDHCGKGGGKPVSRTGIVALEEPLGNCGGDFQQPASFSSSPAVSRRVSDVSRMVSRTDGEAQGLEADGTPSCIPPEDADGVSIFSRPSQDTVWSANEQATISGEDLGPRAKAMLEKPLSDEFPRGDDECRSSDTGKKPTTRILGYCCPKCGQGQLPTLHEAVQHCRQPDDPARLGGIVSEGYDDAGVAATEPLPSARSRCTTSLPSDAASCAPELPALPGEPVAYNSFGQPIIARQVDETGCRTMVLNDDGSCDVFGKQTIASLMSSTETESDDWMQVLSDYQLRGLVHEMGQRLLETSQVYQARLSQWETLSEKANLQFFGLEEGATDRELDVAYRQLSKKMHPDKNGGTEDSKKRFQDMKTRYEALKKKRAEQGSDDKEDKEPTEDPEEESSKEKDERTIEFDPTNRDSLNGTAKKMLSQLSTLDSSMANLVQQLQRHGL